MKNFMLACLAVLFFLCVRTSEANGPANGVNRDEQVEQLLMLSGLKGGLLRIPDDVVAGVRRSPMKGESAEIQNKVARIFADAYPRDGFIVHVTNALNKNYDETRYAHLLEIMSSPLVARMNKLEAVQPSPAEMQGYVLQLAAHPLPPARLNLIRRLDEVTGSSAYMSRVSFASIEAIAMSSAGDCDENAAAIKKEMAKQRAKFEEMTRNSVQVGMAFVYRDASDADLQEYLKISEDKDSRWFFGMARDAIEEQFRTSTEKVAQGLKQLVRASTPHKTMFAPKCGGQKMVKNDDMPARPVHREHHPKVERDLRDCLHLEDSGKIIACTESSR